MFTTIVRWRDAHKSLHLLCIFASRDAQKPCNAIRRFSTAEKKYKDLFCASVNLLYFCKK